MEDLKFQLFSTPILKVLDFLLQHSEMELNDTEITEKIKGTSKNLLRSEILIPSSETRKMSKKPGGVAGGYIDGFFVKSDEVAAEGAKLQPKEVFRGALKGVKRAAVHQALTRLNNMGVLRRTHRNRRCYNALNIGNPWLIHFKITSNILTIMPLIDKLKDAASSIVLFGSRADGTNRSDSDFDIAITSGNSESVNRIARECDLPEKLQLIIKSPSEMLDLESNEPLLAANIRKGIILWEK